MKNTEIQFNADDFIGAVEDVRAHVTSERKITMRTSKLALPKKPAPMSPTQIIALRRTLKMSQPVFARMLNVGAGTAARWASKLLCPIALQVPSIRLPQFLL